MGLALAFGTALGPGPFLPDGLANLAGWWRSDQGITIATGVSQWNDISGAGNNLVQATGAQQPSYTASDSNYNGQPTLGFTAGSSTRMAAAGVNIAQPATWYVVGQALTATGGFTDSTAHAMSIFQDATATFLGLYAGTAISASSGAQTRVPSVMCGVFNGAASFGYVNSSSSPVLSNVNPGASQCNPLTIGGTTFTNPITGKIAEIIVYTGAHTSAQIAQVFAYLGARYGIAAS